MAEQAERNISISVDDMEGIILSRLNTITPAQWTLLSQGVRDSHIRSVMTDILTNIFQQCVEKSLITLVQVMGESKKARLKTETPEENVSVRLTNLISLEIATALEVTPSEICLSGKELNSLMEQEVSQSVTSILNEIRRTPSLPEAPAANVSGYFPKRKNFNRMIFNGIECLQKHLKRTKSRCTERYCSIFRKQRVSSMPTAESKTAFEPSEKSVSPGVKSLCSLVSLTKSISEIIEKYSHDSSDAKNSDSGTDTQPAVHSPEITEVAERVSQTILEDLHYCKSEDSVRQKDRKCCCVPHFELKKIVGDIKRIISSRPKTAPAGKQEITSKPEFSKFSEQQFSNMVSSLKKSLDSCDTKVVKLDCCSPTTNEKMSLLYPGCVPEISEEESAKSVDHVKIKQTFSPKLDYKSIKPRIEKLCAESMENPHLDDMIKGFAKELTDKLYADIMGTHYDKIPVPPKGKCLSDSVISCKKIWDISVQKQICPEVFYARTEDNVRMFLQKIFLWLESEEAAPTTVADKVSGVLSEIDDLVGQIFDPSTQVSSQGTSSPQSCKSENEDNSNTDLPPVFKDPSEAEEGPLTNIATEYSNPSEDDDEEEEDICTFSSHENSLILTRHRLFKKTVTQNRFSASGKTFFKFDEELQLHKGMAIFIANSISNCSIEGRGPLKSKDIKKILAHLSTDDENKSAHNVFTVDNENIKQFVREVYRDLEDEFGSESDIWQAMMYQAGRPFQSAVSRCLQSYLAIKPKKSALHRFFSGIIKPCRNLS